MNPTLYTQLVHLGALAGAVVLGAAGKISPDMAVAAVGALVGVALPSPFAASSTPSKLV